MRDPATLAMWFLVTAGGADCGRDVAIRAAFDPRPLIAVSKPGCIGFTADGRHALVRVAEPGKGGKGLVWASLDGHAQPIASASRELDVLLADHALVPCRAVTPADHLTVGAGYYTVEVVATDRGTARRSFLWVDRDHFNGYTPGLYFDEGAVYVSDAAPGAYVVLHPALHEGELSPDEAAPTVWGIDLRRVGRGPCAQRSNEVAEPPAAPEPFDLDHLGEHCLAMSPDGKAAAFLMRDAQRDATVVRWFGPAPRPGVDLSCLADRCSDATRATIVKDALAAGLVGCPRLDGTVVFDGRAYEVLSDPPHDEVAFEDVHGKVWLAQVPNTEVVLFQLGGGPLYVAGLGDGTQLWYPDEGVWFTNERKIEPDEIAGASAGPGKTVLEVVTVQAHDVGFCRGQDN